jgi:hypothetical protein
MFLLNLKGKPVRVTASKYKINWDKKIGSNAQFKTKQFLKEFWIGESVGEEFIVPSTRLRIDFINFTKKIIIEVSGQQHENFVKFFHRNRTGFLKSIKRDFSKIKWAELNGFDFVEIYDYEVDTLSKEFIQEKFNITI